MLFDGELKIKKGVFTPQMRFFYFLFALSSSLINQQLNKILGTLKKTFFDIFIIEIFTKNIQAPRLSEFGIINDQPKFFKIKNNFYNFT